MADVDPSVNAWRLALIEELVICGIYQPHHEHQPRKALLDLINWHTAVALDPAVSREARALLDQIPSTARQPGETGIEHHQRLAGTFDSMLWMLRENKN